jgi:hypothetical protein
MHLDRRRQLDRLRQREEQWHRDLDKEVIQWLQDPKNQAATPEQFEAWLRWRYSQPDLKARFPNGF